MDTHFLHRRSYRQAAGEQSNCLQLIKLPSTVSNKNIDTVEVPKICTHSFNVEMISVCKYFWHFDCVYIFVGDCTLDIVEFNL